MTDMTPGQRLRAARKEAGYTLEGLARAVGVTLSAVAQWEAGRAEPRRENVERVDATLSAGGALLAAFGYSPPLIADGSPTAATEPSRIDALERQVAELREDLTDLRRDLLEASMLLARVAGSQGHVPERPRAAPPVSRREV